MNAIDTMLVPIDFSDCSAGVVQQAAQLAAQVNARIVLLHAVDAPGGLNDVLVTPAGESEPVSIGDHLRHAAEARMPRYVDLARSVGVEATAAYAPGKPADAILDSAASLGADLIVMGTHGRKGLQRMLLGSVAEKVVRNADAPVMTVRSRWHQGCEARSCATCTTHLYNELDSAQAELDG